VSGGRRIRSLLTPIASRCSLLCAATKQAQAEATKSAQRAGIDHKRQAQPNAYLGRKPSYDRATFDRIRLALDSASPPSLSVIAKAEGLSKQAVFRLKQDPLAALAAWGCDGCSINREPRSNEPHALLPYPEFSWLNSTSPTKGQREPRPSEARARGLRSAACARIKSENIGSSMVFGLLAATPCSCSTHWKTAVFGIF
jgi:hypothetical protein